MKETSMIATAADTRRERAAVGFYGFGKLCVAARDRGRGRLPINQSKFPQARVARELFMEGYAIRDVAKRVGITRSTARSWKRTLFAGLTQPRCQCGEDSGHQGWCSWRYGNSPARQAFMLALHGQRGIRIASWPYALTSTPDELTLAVNEMVPKNVPESIRADVCQDILCALLSGECTPREAVLTVTAFVRRGFREYGTRFDTVSLDAPMAWSDGAPLSDFIGTGGVFMPHAEIDE